MSRQVPHRKVPVRSCAPIAPSPSTSPSPYPDVRRRQKGSGSSGLFQRRTKVLCYKYLILLLSFSEMFPIPQKQFHHRQWSEERAALNWAMWIGTAINPSRFAGTRFLRVISGFFMRGRTRAPPCGRRPSGEGGKIHRLGDHVTSAPTSHDLYLARVPPDNKSDEPNYL